MAPNLAAGELFRIMDQLFNASGAELLLQLSHTGLSSEEVGDIMRDWEMGRNHFFVLTVKLQSWVHILFLWCGVAHADDGGVESNC